MNNHKPPPTRTEITLLIYMLILAIIAIWNESRVT